MAKKSQKRQKERLFEEKLVPAKPGSDRLFDVTYGDEASQPVECLGTTFPNDEARRAHFTELLREKLKDPAFRKIEGFPIGEDEDIVALSDPPYYTACPNPFLERFIEHHGTAYDPKNDDYSRKPFAADVSEGKNDPLYNAHSYHTKVPHRAIMRYVLHYTKPGDVVFDGFCGTGMTGVAAQLCGDRATVQSLGYKVASEGLVLDEDNVPFSQLGARCAVLADTSPAAAFIAYNYNIPTDFAFLDNAGIAIASAKTEVGWSYVSATSKGKPCDIVYVIWSEVFSCPSCSGELVYWKEAFDAENKTLQEEFPCPHCGSTVKKRSLEIAYETIRDPLLNDKTQIARYVPVQLCIQDDKRRLITEPTSADLDTLQKVSQRLKRTDFTPVKVIRGERYVKDAFHRIGIQYIHQFFSHRALLALSAYRKHLTHPRGLWVLTAVAEGSSKLNRERASGLPSKLSGTLYVGSTVREVNVFRFLERKRAKYPRLPLVAQHALVGTGSVFNSGLPENSVDYIFTDPPFGDNLHYAELNSLWEWWLGVRTDPSAETSIDKGLGKSFDHYSRGMARAFREYFHILKPGRWITVEFHNSKNAVWNAIQDALGNAGFVVADVRVLDKQQETFKQSQQQLVKVDLVISAYKTPTTLEMEFSLKAGTDEGAWRFIESHLGQLPAITPRNGKAVVLAERQRHLLFDRMVAFHVQRGYSVPLSATEFYAGLRRQFAERDGMYFLPEQASEYDLQRLSVNEMEQLELFVNDEKTAIQWVRSQLTKQPTAYQQLSPIYMKEAQRLWEKHEQPVELRTILEQNFVEADDGSWRVPDSRKESDLEQLRHRALIKEFQQYLDTKGKLKIVRTEALRAGFKECWQKKDYATIVQMAKRVPEAVIQEDPHLLMYFDNASLLKGE